MSVANYDPPDRFVAGTVGPPGQRAFFLQAAGPGARTTCSLEKFQVEALGDRIRDLLEATANIPATPMPADNNPLTTPFDDEFRIRSMSLQWDPERELVVIECHDRDPDGDEDEAEHARQAGLPATIQTLRVAVPATVAHEFARRCTALVSAGRPPCPFCGGPLDPEGHICPRANGYRR